MTAKFELRNGPTFSKPLIDVLQPLHTTLSDQSTDNTYDVTAFPIYSPEQVPAGLIELMADEFNREIANGDTYPQSEPLTHEAFIDYWFHSFCAILLRTSSNDLPNSVTDWSNLFLGTFYVKPNYMSRCSHNCNAGFLVNSKVRGHRIGDKLAKIYLAWAPLLGYKYSVFNLVFTTNEASWRIWDRYNFQRIGLVPKAGILKGYEEPVDAIIYGKDLTQVEPEFLEGL